MGNIPSNLKVGIIGCGNMARVHLRLLTKSMDKQNIAVCDKDQLRLMDFAKSTGIKQTFTDLEKMIRDFYPEIVHIVTPPHSHKNLAVYCLENGCHVLIEKPMCLSTEEADEIIAAAAKHQRLVCVDHMRSFDPLIQQAKKFLDSGQFGEIVNIATGYSYDYLKKVDTDAAARWINDLPGGTFFDLMPHMLCLLDDFLPGFKLERSTHLRNENNLITDLLCIFSSAKGTGTLHMSLNIFPLKNYIEFECTNGILRVDLRNFLIIKRKHSNLPNAVERIVGNLNVGFQYIFGSLGSVFNFLRGRLDPYAGLGVIIREFQTAVSNNGASPVPAQKAKSLLELTQSIFPQEDKRTQAPSNPLAPADVLVTGGTGFIGRRLVNRLIEKGYRVRVFTHRQINQNELLTSAQLMEPIPPESGGRDTDYHSGALILRKSVNNLFTKPVDIFQGNIYDYEQVQQACSGVKVIYHLAAAMKGNWNYHLDTTVTGSQNIVRAAEHTGVQHLVYVSTLNVYNAKNYPNSGFIDEGFAFEDNPEKRGVYSQAKLQAENFVREQMEKLPLSITILRPGLVYGPGYKTFFQDIGLRIGKKLVIVFGMGWRRIPLVYVDNLVDALMLAGESTKKGTYNVVDGDYPSQRQFIKTYRQLTHKGFFVLYFPFWIVYSGFWVLEKLVSLCFRKNISLSYKLRCISKSPRHSTKRIESELGWSPKVNFQDGLKQAVEDENRRLKTARP